MGLGPGVLRRLYSCAERPSRPSRRSPQLLVYMDATNQLKHEWAMPVSLMPRTGVASAARMENPRTQYPAYRDRHIWYNNRPDSRTEPPARRRNLSKTGRFSAICANRVETVVRCGLSRPPIALPLTQKKRMLSVSARNASVFFSDGAYRLIGMRPIGPLNQLEIISEFTVFGFRTPAKPVAAGRPPSALGKPHRRLIPTRCAYSAIHRLLEPGVPWGTAASEMFRAVCNGFSMASSAARVMA
jgi:hypothetical protein